MPGRVFISCGQATAEERRVAADIRLWLEQEGFEPHVAIEVQSLADITAGIVDKLKSADFYIFIDFRRERILKLRNLINPCKPSRYRGSLFTNQELAISYLLQFEKAIFLQQKGVQLEGLLRYIGANAQPFSSAKEVPVQVKKLVEARSWTPAYSRHLTVGEQHWTPALPYVDHTGTKHVRVFEPDIHNRRSDVAALNAVARLTQITSPDGRVQRDVDISPLKTTGQPGYIHAIWPKRHAAWDLFAVHTEAPATVSLNSSLDVIPRRPIISSSGDYLLTYEIFAVNFPVLTFNVRLVVKDDPMATSATVEPLEA